VEAYLRGRIAIITGGFSGIGKAIALALAERGATIAVGLAVAHGHALAITMEDIQMNAGALW
jgi:NAD(P)-dependent dehydrogenase (short-subunit alcohol dehydrogenase family)